jgi:hypothetical protein
LWAISTAAEAKRKQSKTKGHDNITKQKKHRFQETTAEAPISRRAEQKAKKADSVPNFGVKYARTYHLFTQTLQICLKGLAFVRYNFD